MSDSTGKKTMSEAALAANRENAKKSTGPKTPEGKTSVKYNASKHYGYCSDPLIPGESPEDYDRFASCLAESLEYCNGMQFTLMDSLIAELWCWQRMVRYESNIYIFTPDQGFFLDEMDKLTRIKNRRWHLIERMFKQFYSTKDRMASAIAMAQLMNLAHQAYEQVKPQESNEQNIPEAQPETVLPVPVDECVVMTNLTLGHSPTVCPERWGRNWKKDESGGYTKMIDMLLGLIRTPNARVVDIIRDRASRRPWELQWAQMEALEALFQQEVSPNPENEGQ